MIRLRQIAFAATDLQKSETALVNQLGVQLCFRDAGVLEFGLANALFPVGDQFLEIVSPVQENTTAGRLLDKQGGDCGYMAIFQVDDIGPVTDRLSDREIRIVFHAKADGIEGLHLHPKDVPGAIVSIDASAQPSEWTWAGPNWRDCISTGRVESISGLTIATENPTETCEIWGYVLGVSPTEDTLKLDDAVVHFSGLGAEQRTGLVGVQLKASAPELVGTSAELLGVTVNFV